MTSPCRCSLPLMLAALLCAGTGLRAQQQQRVRLQQQQQIRQQQQARRNTLPPGGRGAPKGEHLAEWMNAHRNLSPGQQQQALENEPGFRELPPQTQQRMRDRLAQLNAMTPQQQQRVIERNEHMETLTPDQRSQVRGAMQQLGALPPDQMKTVARSFRQLRDLPPDQRAGAMGRIPLNDAQRATLNNLLRVEPLLPPPEGRE